MVSPIKNGSPQSTHKSFGLLVTVLCNKTYTLAQLNLPPGVRLSHLASSYDIFNVVCAFIINL